MPQLEFNGQQTYAAACISVSEVSNLDMLRKRRPRERLEPIKERRCMALEIISRHDEIYDAA